MVITIDKTRPAVRQMAARAIAQAGSLPPGYTIEQFMAEAGHAWAVLHELRPMDMDDGIAWSDFPPKELAERIVRLSRMTAG